MGSDMAVDEYLNHRPKLHIDSHEAGQHKTKATKQHMHLICIAVNGFRQRTKRLPTASTD